MALECVVCLFARTLIFILMLNSYYSIPFSAARPSLSLYLSGCLSVCLFSPSVRLSIHPSTYPSVRLIFTGLSFSLLLHRLCFTPIFLFQFLHTVPLPSTTFFLFLPFSHSPVLATILTSLLLLHISVCYSYVVRLIQMLMLRHHKFKHWWPNVKCCVIKIEQTGFLGALWFQHTRPLTPLDLSHRPLVSLYDW